MPAESVTGGPRVLHCVERADCPITRGPPIFSSLLPTPAYRSDSPTRDPWHQKARHRRRCSTRESKLLGLSAEPLIIPGNNERDEFFRDEVSATISTTSSNDLEELGDLRDPRNRKRANVLRRRTNRRTSVCNELEVQLGVASPSDFRDVRNVEEITRREVTPVNDTQQRLSHLTATSTCHLVRVVHENRRDCIAESSTIVIRLFDGYRGCGCVELNRESVCPILGKLPAAISSQRDRPPVGIETFTSRIDPLRGDDETRGCCVECAWRCESECAYKCPLDELRSARSSAVEVTRERRKRYRQVQHKGRSYLQLAMLLFLIVFRHNSFFKSSSVGYSGRAVIGVGIGALTIGTIVGAVRAGPVDLDAGVRAERSANLSHITGVSRKIQMYVKTLHLQLLPDGTVNGSKNDTSDYKGVVRLDGYDRPIPIKENEDGEVNIPNLTFRSKYSRVPPHIRQDRLLDRGHAHLFVGTHARALPMHYVHNEKWRSLISSTIFQRYSVSRGQLRIQGVATCLYLCMDSCGLLYGSRNYTDDCLFNETLEQHNYNTYSSVRWSTANKILYLGLNRRGQPRRVQAKGHNLGRLSTYARVLTQVVSPERVRALQNSMFRTQHNLRHHRNSHHNQFVCPNVPSQEKDSRDKFRCRKRKKRKKLKKQCKEGEKSGAHCEIAEQHKGNNAEIIGEGTPQSKRSCEGAASEKLCRKQALDAPAKKRKSRIQPKKPNVSNKEKQHRNRGKEVRPKKTADEATKPNFAGSVDDDSMKNANRLNARKRKRPLLKQRPDSANIGKKVTGRVTRTTVVANPTASGIAVPLPSSWYPSTSTIPSTEAIATTDVSSWRRIKTAASPKNAVTSGELKTSDTQSTRYGKALEVVGYLPDTFMAEASTEASTEAEDHSACFNDSSVETSEEAKSEEFILEEDSTTFFAEYNTLMTTMDTTPPERTEDYARATTPSILSSAEVEGESIDEFQDSVRSGDREFNREVKPPFGRFAN